VLIQCLIRLIVRAFRRGDVVLHRPLLMVMLYAFPIQWRIDQFDGDGQVVFCLFVFLLSFSIRCLFDAISDRRYSIVLFRRVARFDDEHSGVMCCVFACCVLFDDR